MTHKVIDRERTTGGLKKKRDQILILKHKSPTLLCQRVTPVIVGSFAGRTWKNKWYTNCLNYCKIFIVYTQFANVAAGRKLVTHALKDSTDNILQYTCLMLSALPIVFGFFVPQRYEKIICFFRWEYLEKAFDSVNHYLLLSKLPYCGVRGKAKLLLQSYLQKRYQRVQIINSYLNSNTVSK